MPHCNKKMLSFFLTTRCNLCCRYCYNAAERNSIEEKTIPLNIAQAAIDWYFSSNQSRHIRFYGPGEPTQEFDKMRLITQYARQYKDGGDQVTVEIQSNGVFTKEVRDWVLDNVNILWLSFDGMKEVQNYNRPLNPKYSHIYENRTSAEILEDNVRWLISNKQDRNLMVGARVTITDMNLTKQRDMVDYFGSLGIQYVWTNPLFYSVGTIPVCADEIKKKNYSFDMDAYVDEYLDAYYYAKSKDIFWGSFLTINFDGESAYHCRCCTPQNAPHITPDGYVSACDMVVLGEEAHHMGLFIVGKWNDEKEEFDFYEDKIKTLNNRKSTLMTHCKNCPAQLHCGGYCLGETVNETGHLDGQNIIKCRAIRKLLKELGSCAAYPYLHP